MGQAKEILIGAVTIAIGYALAKVVYNKFLGSASATTTTASK